MRVRGWVCFFGIVVNCAFCAAQSPVTSKSSTSPPNVILITLDTTRADRMGFLRSDRGLTPNLDALARDAVVFSRAYAQVPLTTPSHAALLTGTYPQFNHISDLGAPLSADIPYLPDILRRRGYHTAAFVGAYILDPKVQARGFDRGFETYDAKFHRRGPHEDRYASVERRASVVVDRALSWLQTRPPAPFFAWLHFYDAHDPYDPPSPYREKYPSSPYDGEIAYADSQVGRFIEALKSRKLYGNTIIVVAADHGEAFGEHGEQRHGMFLYDETIHVPLLIKLVNQRPSAKRIEDRVALADVAPTILGVLGIAPPKAMQGRELLKGSANATQASSATAEGSVYSETDYPHRAFGWGMERSWRAGKYLYIQSPKRELYDQSSDPGANHNLAEGSKAVADTLQGQLDSFHEKTSTAKSAQQKMDPAQAENLRALGYLASDTTTTSGLEKDAIDPKDNIKIANVMHEALVDTEEDRYDAAIPKFEKVIQEVPQAASAYLELGRAFIHTKAYDKALPVLRTAVEKMPESGIALYELGLALVKTGQWEAALPEFQRALSKSPESAQLHFYVAVVLARLKRVPEATQEFENTLKMDPDHYLANLIYGRLLFLEGQPKEALTKLRHAEKLKPEAREPHKFLADLYTAIGQPQKATQERALAEQGTPGEVP
jgi:arylsulfatase A-like enzyme/Flp pilus assembly protein TadD